MIGYIVPLFYTATEIAIAGTPGKLITGLRITNLDGSEAPLARLVSRWTVKWSYLLLGLLGTAMHQTLIVWLGNLMAWVIFFGCVAAAGEAKLAWHDRWAQTAVRRIRARSGNSGVRTRFESIPISRHAIVSSCPASSSSSTGFAHSTRRRSSSPFRKATTSRS